MRVSVIGVAVVLVAPAAATAGVHAPPLAFEGVELGTTEAAWRGLTAPGPTPEHARRACSDDRAGAAGGLTTQGLPEGAVVCGIVDTYGSLRLPVTFQWDRRYPMDHLRFVFQQGRLTEIRARLPMDAFDALTADFGKSFGPPSYIQRDSIRSEVGRLPRVKETWALPQGRIEIVVPDNTESLSIRLAALPEGAP
jgi:hypothetical protein